ncbi:hypothetical protein GDO81_004863 [Engystomops pustulosus]|uniref:DASH complex subunit DAD2 n=1 Tax=Engystomops pustulosus TaxID=76066 RepID=A0AAV7CJM4_ENGPU|nr:hypothetical protein GDO81_004863 [Engystomops pustulosus]
MSAGRKKNIPRTPSQSEQKETSVESVQLQQELETLRQVHSSIAALNQMTLTLQKTLESVAKNNGDMKNLNEGWKIFFGQR